MREREADRQIKEGLPRNFLLVDEYTKKPYGVGVGAWRKELMLLSQKLDPAIGNINRHPEEAVQEIADWINDTWEYSAPLCFEYVKEVIARGVTLRRVALWRKIRNGEPKPPTVSDRSWRTLGRQLHSPATIEKAESCRKANASRMNFGRTGPSGEVGVRQRLRRALRRSPDPEEIQEEMARDKGCGGYQRERKSDHVMHGSEGPVLLYVEGKQHSGRSGSSGDNEFAEDEDNADMHAVGDRMLMPMRPRRKEGQDVGTAHVLAMTDDEVAQHPLVMRLMQRLSAVEGRGSIDLVDRNGPAMQDMSAARGVGGDEVGGGHMNSDDNQVRLHFSA